MSHVLLDTHVWAWSLTNPQRLSTKALAAIEAAETVSISAISLYEIGQKVRLGKWPEMALHLPALIEIADRQGGRILPVSAAASLAASMFDWLHRDPFDRIIGAAALMDGLTLISADDVFDELSGMPGWLGRLW